MGIWDGVELWSPSHSQRHRKIFTSINLHKYSYFHAFFCIKNKFPCAGMESQVKQGRVVKVMNRRVRILFLGDGNVKGPGSKAGIVCTSYYGPFRVD
jgi:hypothetical protein